MEKNAKIVSFFWKEWMPNPADTETLLISEKSRDNQIKDDNSAKPEPQKCCAQVATKRDEQERSLKCRSERTVLYSVHDGN